MTFDADVLIIGAGPSGAVAAKLLRQRGYQVLVLERAEFPRFSIGESMLPQTMELLKKADMLSAIEQGDFQFKDGACFCAGNKEAIFDFGKQFSNGHTTAFQVERGKFDKILADNAAAAGADIHYSEEILDVDFSGAHPKVKAKDLKTGKLNNYQCRFVFDASGFGRVLPRLLDLETPSNFPSRQSLFTHIEDNIIDASYDRHKITVDVHPHHRDVWYWLIPFSNGRCSIGVVAEESFFEQYPGTNEERLKKLISESAKFSSLLKQANYDSRVNQITGYSANVKTLWGEHFCLLGNAGEFLDPVFSSGVTIAVKSADLAVNCVDQFLQGKTVDWQSDYAQALQKGVDTFRVYVEAWYNGDFQDIIFHENAPENVKDMICSILSGYAWDETNPYVAQSRRRLKVLTELCQLEFTADTED
ncbi:MAG: tryptophan 7-halogenase [Pseudomonadales bacterium]|nr:tryptophan 7-halogenase [Pseudomonadales bacterium]